MSKKKKEKAKKQFLGALITKKKKKNYSEQYQKDYIEKIKNEGNPDNLSDEEIQVLARGYAFFQVRREMKHLKAYLKGQTSYKYRGKYFPVLSTESFKQQEQLTNSIKEEE